MNRKIFIPGITLILIHIMGMIWSDTFWSSHYLAFLSPIWSFFFLVVPMVLITLASYEKTSVELISNWLDVRLPIPTIGLYIILSVLMASAFLSLPIANDIYGDAVLMKQSVDATFETMPEKYKGGLYSFDLSPSGGRRTMLALYTYISVWTGASYGQIFKWTGAVSGIIFLLLWIQFLNHSSLSVSYKLLFIVTVLTAPFLLIFYGHLEFYPFVYVAQMGWYLLLIRYFKRKEVAVLWALALLLIINIKIHPTALLFVPAFFMAVVYHHHHLSTKLPIILTWEGIMKYLFLPIVMAGAYLYFFYFESYNDPRNVENSIDLDHVFLPLLSPDPPYDRYNLLSLNHILDFFKSTLNWSIPVLFLIAYIIWTGRKRIDWHRIELKALLFTALIMYIFLFMLNPLVSMPMDWDLFSLPALPVLVVLVLLLQQLELKKFTQTRIMIAVLGLSLLTVPVFWVNASMPKLSERLESLGVHIFKTYYEWSETTLLTAVGMMHRDSISTDYINRKNRILEKIRPYAIPGNDTIFSMLLVDNGIYYEKVARNQHKALEQYKEAERYDSDNPYSTLKLLEVNFRLKNFQDAFMCAEKLVKMRFPDQRKSLRMAIHCALEADKRSEALKYSQEYVNSFPKDRNIRSVLNDLRDSLPIENILKHFYPL